MADVIMVVPSGTDPTYVEIDAIQYEVTGGQVTVPDKYFAMLYGNGFRPLVTPESVAAADPPPAVVATTARPESPVNGQCVFDSDLGKPIWWDSAKWVDATGADMTPAP